MSYRFIKSLPSCAKAYVPRLLNKSGVRGELFGKPILVIGDVPANESKTEYDNISKCFDYPTMTMTRFPINPESKSNGVGKFEIYGSLSEYGELFIEDIGYGQADVFSKKYAEFIRNNPILSKAYDMQSGGRKVVSPYFISHVNDEAIRSHCVLEKSVPVSGIRYAANRMQEMNISSYFDLLFINGNGVTDDEEKKVISLFNNVRIPIRYVSVSGTCPLTLKQNQRSVIVAQEILDAISINSSEITHVQKTVDKSEGKGRVISIISKSRS